MSAGNGRPNLAKAVSVVPIPAPLSATEREQQRIAYVQAVDNMATTLRETAETVKGLMQLTTQLYAIDKRRELRLDALERAEAVRRALSFMARLRWLVGL